MVGSSYVGGVPIATEWSGGSIINLGGLSGSTESVALSINAAGQVVGSSQFGPGLFTATEWSGGIGGSIINLEGLPGSTRSSAAGINDAGQAVGDSYFGDVPIATEWSGGSITNLGGLPGSTFSIPIAINDLGQAVGEGGNLLLVPEPSTWAMMLLGFAGLAFAGYRRSKRVLGNDARFPTKPKNELNARYSPL